jgi:hypothetical protein
MDDETFRALVEQSHQLHELTSHPGWAVLVDRMHVVMNPAKRKILNGNSDSFDDYLKMTGFLTGIHRVLDMHDEIGEMVVSERQKRAEIEAATAAAA